MNSWISIIVFNFDFVTTVYCIENYVCCMERAVLETCINSNSLKISFTKDKSFLKVNKKHTFAMFIKIALVSHC